MHRASMYITGIGILGSFVGIRSGLFGHNEVDGDLIIHGLTRDWVYKRRLSKYFDDDEVAHWCWELDCQTSIRPPHLTGLEKGTKWRRPPPFPEDDP